MKKEKSIRLFQILEKNPILLWKFGNSESIAAQQICTCNMLIDAIMDLGDLEHSNDWDLGITLEMNNKTQIQSAAGHPELILGWLNETDQENALNYLHETFGSPIKIGITVLSKKNKLKKLYVSFSKIHSIQYWR